MDEPRMPGASMAPPSGHVIAGVPGLAWGKNGDCTFVGSLVAATAVTPYPCAYETTMGATGLAFRVRWYQGTGDTRCCASSPIGECPEEAEAARLATGWRLRAEHEDGSLARLAPDIMASLMDQLPVLAYDDRMDVGVIFGAENDGRTVLMHDYFHGDETVRRDTANLKILVVFLNKHEEPISDAEAALQGIRMGARFFHTRHDPEDKEEEGYWLGSAAFEKWAEDLGLVSTLSEAERANLFMVNWWNYEGLTDARLHAGPFLRKAIPWFPGAAREDLEAAATLYETEAKKLRSALLGGELFTGPWSGRTITHWTAEMRKSEQQLLRTVAENEIAAMRHIEAAIATVPDEE